VVSASAACVTDDVPTAERREPSATNPGLVDEVDEVLQSNLIVVDPAVTFDMRSPLIAPVPTDTLTVQGGVETCATALADAEDTGPAATAPSSATQPATTTSSELTVERCDRVALDFLVSLFICFHP